MTNFDVWKRELGANELHGIIDSCRVCPNKNSCMHGVTIRTKGCRDEFDKWANAEAPQTAPVTNFGKVTESVEALARILADNSFCDDVCTANPCLNDKGEHLCIKYAKEWLESEVGDEK